MYDARERKAPLLMAAAMACLLALCLSAAPAWASKVITTPVDPSTGEPLAIEDDITRLHVSKLEKDTREPVSGAQMQIKERDTGEVVDTWVTDGSVHEIEKVLDVGKPYVLEEVSAPEGYAKVSPIEFELNETEGAGVRVLSADNGEWWLYESYRLEVYDLDLEHETVVHERREGPPPSSSSSSSSSVPPSKAPRTGDDTPVLIVGLVALAALAAVFATALIRRKRS